VTIAGRTERKLEGAATELPVQGLEVGYAVCDALDPASVRTAVAAAPMRKAGWTSPRGTGIDHQASCCRR